jgi:hypothetical protein
MAETAMQQQSLGRWVHFAIRGIVLNELQKYVSAVVADLEPPLPLASIKERVKDFESRFRTIMSIRSRWG